MIVKGDLTNDGTDEEFAAFEACYRDDVRRSICTWCAATTTRYRGQSEYAGDQWIDLPGVSIALLDTVVPERTHGTIAAPQLEWLDDHARREPTDR